jgi:hypothetical protein
MRVGDRVFFWRAAAGDKERPGVIAAGRIESTPQELPQDTESLHGVGALPLSRKNNP